eukprot:s1286_g17.t2
MGPELPSRTVTLSEKVEPIFPEGSPSVVCHVVTHEVDHLSLRSAERLRTNSDNTDEQRPEAEDAGELTHVQEVLGPPLDFLPKDIELQDLNAYRLDYQNFRAGNASGARGEVAALCGEASKAAVPYKTGRKAQRPRLVPLIGLDLATSSAVRSAASAASEHLEEMAMAQIRWGPSGTGLTDQSEESGLSGPELLPTRKSCLKESKPDLKLRRVGAGPAPRRSDLLRQSSAPGGGHGAHGAHGGHGGHAAELKRSWQQLMREGAIPTATLGMELRCDQLGMKLLLMSVDVENPEVMSPWQRSSSASPVTSKTGIGFFTHIAVSMLCLVPYATSLHRICAKPEFDIFQKPMFWGGPVVRLVRRSSSLRCLVLPTAYSAYVILMSMKLLLKDEPPSVMTRVLRMERLVKEGSSAGSVPSWFPNLASIVYLVMVYQLELGHSFQSTSKSQRSTLLSASPQRHDYNCWGTDQEDVADCVLVRHAGYTITVSFYICLIVMAVCNRKVKGSDLVGEHERSLQELFPMEAPSLLAYVERSVKSNSTFWRSHRRYKAQSVVLSLSWTLMSFGVYWELMQGAKTKVAQVVFCTALVCTYALQYTLLRHVLLRVILHLEGIKARAAAMAFCDEEGVLPFDSAHSVYVWFSVRRNVQAQNEVAYQNASPIFTAMLICAAACSCWVISQLRQKGITVFGLTSRGGASLMVVASALVSSIFVGVFLRTLLEISKLEDAHVRQLRIAHLRLEHARCILKVQKEMEPPLGCKPGSSHSRSKKRISRDLSMSTVGDEQDMEGALLMIERVISLLEQHDVKPTIFGVEIGSKSFQVVYAALLSNLWYLLVWGFCWFTPHIPHFICP